jgi:RimJ/RimL family protein N-acetyltransferase
MKVLDTERLILRWLTAEDAPFMLGLLNEPSFLQHIGDRGVRTVEDARRYIHTVPMTSYARFGFGLYLVEPKEGGEPMGICGLVKRDALKDVDLGFAFLPRFWSKGYAFESASAVLAHARSDLGLKRIVAIVSPGNAASVGLLEKLGFRLEGLTRLSDDAPEVQLFGLKLSAER